MAAPNDGTTQLPADDSARFFVGGWDVANGVFRALRASVGGFLLILGAKGTPTNTQVSVTTSSTLVLAANANRKMATIYNVGPATAYLKAATGAVAATDKPLPAGAEFVDDNSLSIWHAITASGTADIRVMEVS